MKKPVITHTRKVTFEVYDEHPKVNDYFVFANETVEKTQACDLDFAFAARIENGIVYSPDLSAPVMLKYCWKLRMHIHD